MTSIKTRSRPKAVHAAIEALRETDGSDPSQLVSRAIGAVRDAAEADAAMFYSVARIDDGTVPLDWRIEGPSLVTSGLETFFAGSPTLPMDFGKSRSAETRGFLDLGTMLRLYPRPAQRQARTFLEVSFDPFQIIDQLRLLVFSETRCVGWIGAMRMRGQAGFSASDGRRLSPLVADVSNALLRADDVARHQTPATEGAVLLLPNGRIEYADAAARSWLDSRARARLEAAVCRAHRAGDADRRVASRAGEIRITRLRGMRATRYLVRLSRAQPVVRRADAALSPAQLAVADYAASSCTIDEISRHLGVSRETVRTHLREVYRRLHVSTRAELARALSE